MYSAFKLCHTQLHHFVCLFRRLRFLRYVPGEYFKPHHDGIYQRDNGEASLITVQIYLNEVRRLVSHWRNTLPWIGRVGLWKAFEPVCYEIYYIKKDILKVEYYDLHKYHSKLHGFPFTSRTNTRANLWSQSLTPQNGRPFFFAS